MRWRGRRRSGNVEDRRGRGGVAVAGGGVGLVVMVIAALVFGVDPTSRFWPLLVVPVLEGAHRGGVRGAWATWALSSVGYVVEQLVHLDTKPEPGSWISAILWGVAILAIVAGGAGTLAERSEQHRRRIGQQNRRLRELAESSIHLTSAQRIAEVADGTMDAMAGGRR